MSTRIDSARAASLVRRPIFDQSLEVVAYELVLGAGPITDISVADADGHGPRLTINSVTDVDLAEIGADKPLHFAVSSSLLAAGIPPALAPEQTIVVLGAEIEPTPSTISVVETLRAAGFRIVLDDPVANPQLHSLLHLAHAVKIGLASGDAQPGFARQIDLLKATDVTLIADGIGSYEELRRATDDGFEQFQGSFLSRPEAFRKTQAPSEQLAALELVTLLQDPDAEVSDIAEVIRRDVNLSYRILKVVNSAQYSLQRPLGSIEEAVVLVGTKKIVSWVGMMNMSGLNGKPTELARAAMIRARVCETLAPQLDRADVQRFYLVGLFSVIEAMLDVPAQQALGSLPLAVEIVDAIASGGGIMGEVLRAVVAYEQGDWDRAQIVGLDDRAIMAAFMTATIETDKTWSQIAGAN